MRFSTLPERVAEVRQRIAAATARGGHGQDVRIIAVTKTHGPDAVLAALAAGLTAVGENKVQEALEKQEGLAARVAMTGGIPAIGTRATPTNVIAAGLEWHLIGHLQRNKVKFLDRFALFHAVDSSRLADAIDAFGQSLGRPVGALLEVNVSGEATKGGFPLAEVEREAARLAGRTGIRIVGVMTMAPFEAEERLLREVFTGARSALDAVAAAGHPARELSMGMSGDYEVAVEEGATMVRLGTVLFGERGG